MIVTSSFEAQVRRAIAALALTIGIVTMVLVDYFAIGDSTLSVKLHVDNDTDPFRQLGANRTVSVHCFIRFYSEYTCTQVSILPVPLWFVFYSIPAGLLLFMVLFIETEVCESVVDCSHCATVGSS